MLALASPRVQITDKTDPFISQYTVPNGLECSDVDPSPSAGQEVKILKWNGLISIQWVLELICAIM